MEPEECLGPSLPGVSSHVSYKKRDKGVGSSIDDSAGGPIYSRFSEESSCKHDFEFKYKEEKMTEDGRIKTLEYFHCRHCLEEKVKEK